MFPKVIYCLVVVVDVNLNVVSVTTYVQTLHATRLPSLYIKYFHLRNRRPLSGARHFLCLLLHLASVRMSIMYFFIYRCSMNTLLHFDKNFAFLSQFVFMSTEYYQNVAFEKPWLGSVCPVTALWLKIDGVKFSLEILYLQRRPFFVKPQKTSRTAYNLFFLQRFQ